MLGTHSGIVDIDVDGDKGESILLDWSKDELPSTLMYTTPGDGKRLLYKIPEHGKDKRFKKYAKPGTGDHTECALLGDGQQTVLPYSVHPNGGIYEFVEGHGSKQIGMAEMPTWMFEMMTAKNTQSGKSCSDSKDLGLIYNADGKLVGINGNTYVREVILKNLPLIFDQHDYLIYQPEGYWKRSTERELKTILYQLFNSLEKDAWTGGIEKTYTDVLPHLCESSSCLQSGEGVINLQNGLLNTRTFTLEPHSKNVFTTMQLPIEYDPDATCKTFSGFLNDIFSHDKERINLLQEIFGYCLSSETCAHKLFFFVGTGSNGKSTLTELLFELAGGVANVSTVSLKNFSRNFSLSQIVDKTLNISNENEVQGSLDTEVLKSVCSGDLINVERKYEQPFSYRPFCKLLFCMNSLPYTKDRSHGLERRLILLPFDKTFVEKPISPKQGTRDNTLPARLKAELPGIFTFAMQGLKRLRKNNWVFTNCKACEETLADYRHDVNPYLCFTSSGSNSQGLLIKTHQTDRATKNFMKLL